MNQLFRAILIMGVAWAGISTFKNVVAKIEEEELARLGAGESDYQRHHTALASHQLKTGKDQE